MNLADLFSLAWFLLTIFCAIAIHVREGRIAALEAANDTLRADLADALMARDEANQLIATQHKQIRGHLIESVVMMEELQRLKRSEDEAIVEDVARWLAQEETR